MIGAQNAKLLPPLRVEQVVDKVICPRVISPCLTRDISEVSRKQTSTWFSENEINATFIYIFIVVRISVSKLRHVVHHVRMLPCFKIRSYLACVVRQ